MLSFGYHWFSQNDPFTFSVAINKMQRNKCSKFQVLICDEMLLEGNSLWCEPWKRATGTLSYYSEIVEWQMCSIRGLDTNLKIKKSLNFILITIITKVLKIPH